MLNKDDPLVFDWTPDSLVVSEAVKEFTEGLEVRKVICDCCTAEIKEARGRVIQFPCHIVEQDGGGYIDPETREAVSGRNVPFDLCLKCYNRLWTNTWEFLQGMTAVGGGSVRGSGRVGL